MTALWAASPGRAPHHRQRPSGFALRVFAKKAYPFLLKKRMQIHHVHQPTVNSHPLETLPCPSVSIYQAPTSTGTGCKGSGKGCTGLRVREGVQGQLDHSLTEPLLSTCPPEAGTQPCPHQEDEVLKTPGT